VQIELAASSSGIDALDRDIALKMQAASESLTVDKSI